MPWSWEASFFRIIPRSPVAQDRRRHCSWGRAADTPPPHLLLASFEAFLSFRALTLVCQARRKQSMRSPPGRDPWGSSFTMMSSRSCFRVARRFPVHTPRSCCGEWSRTSLPGRPLIPRGPHLCGSPAVVLGMIASMTVSVVSAGTLGFASSSLPPPSFVCIVAASLLCNRVHAIGPVADRRAHMRHANMS